MRALGLRSLLKSLFGFGSTQAAANLQQPGSAATPIVSGAPLQPYAVKVLNSEVYGKGTTEGSFRFGAAAESLASSTTTAGVHHAFAGASESLVSSIELNGIHSGTISVESTLTLGISNTGRKNGRSAHLAVSAVTGTVTVGHQNAAGTTSVAMLANGVATGIHHAFGTSTSATAVTAVLTSSRTCTGATESTLVMGASVIGEHNAFASSSIAPLTSNVVAVGRHNAMCSASASLVSSINLLSHKNGQDSATCSAIIGFIPRKFGQTTLSAVLTATAVGDQKIRINEILATHTVTTGVKHASCALAPAIVVGSTNTGKKRTWGDAATNTIINSLIVGRKADRASTTFSAVIGIDLKSHKGGVGESAVSAETSTFTDGFNHVFAHVYENIAIGAVTQGLKSGLGSSWQHTQPGSVAKGNKQSWGGTAAHQYLPNVVIGLKGAGAGTVFPIVLHNIPLWKTGRKDYVYQVILPTWPVVGLKRSSGASEGSTATVAGPTAWGRKGNWVGSLHENLVLSSAVSGTGNHASRVVQDTVLTSSITTKKSTQGSTAAIAQLKVKLSSGKSARHTADTSAVISQVLHPIPGRRSAVSQSLALTVTSQGLKTRETSLTTLANSVTTGKAQRFGFAYPNLRVGEGAVGHKGALAAPKVVLLIQNTINDTKNAAGLSQSTTSCTSSFTHTTGRKGGCAPTLLVFQDDVHIGRTVTGTASATLSESSITIGKKWRYAPTVARVREASVATGTKHGTGQALSTSQVQAWLQRSLWRQGATELDASVLSSIQIGKTLYGTTTLNGVLTDIALGDDQTRYATQLTMFLSCKEPSMSFMATEPGSHVLTAREPATMITAREPSYSIEVTAA